MNSMQCVGPATSSPDLLANLRPVFGGATPVFMVTDAVLLGALESRGIETHLLDADDDGPVPPSAVVVISRATTLALTESIRDRFASSRVVVVPTAAFDASTHAALYTIDAMLASDFVASTERIRRWKEALRRLPSPLVFVDPRHPERELRCHLLGDLAVNGRETHCIEPGEWVGAASFFEVEMEAFGTAPSLFCVEGKLSVSGMLTAKAANMTDEVQLRHDVAVRGVHEFATWGGGVLWCEANKPVRLGAEDGRAQDHDALLDRLLAAAGPAYGANVVEFSIGTNVTRGLDVDWSVNSCMNEGMRGVHIGVGDGACGSHIDFVSAGTNPQLVS
jgi:hypothetical protein